MYIGHSLNGIGTNLTNLKYGRYVYKYSILQNSKNQNLNKLIIKRIVGASILGESPYIVILYYIIMNSIYNFLKR